MQYDELFWFIEIDQKRRMYTRYVNEYIFFNFVFDLMRFLPAFLRVKTAL